MKPIRFGPAAAIFAFLFSCLAGGSALAQETAARSAQAELQACRQSACDIRILFTYTTEGAERLTEAASEWGNDRRVLQCVREHRATWPAQLTQQQLAGHCLLRRLAQDSVEALELAFRRSGVEGINLTWHVSRHSDAASLHGIDAGETLAERFDNGSIVRRRGEADLYAGQSANAFNQGFINSIIGETAHPAVRERIERLGETVNLIVVFNGRPKLHNSDGRLGCGEDAVADPDFGVFVVPGCLASPDRQRGLLEGFVHELGHVFGADHDENAECTNGRESRGFCTNLIPVRRLDDGREVARADMQPCAPTSSACAWDSCTGDLRSAPEAQRVRIRARCAQPSAGYCTVMGQWNFQTRSFCIRRTPPQAARWHHGWIQEFSHPGPCQTPGLQTRGNRRPPCGNVNRYNAARTIQANARTVANMRAGVLRALPSRAFDTNNSWPRS